MEKTAQIPFTAFQTLARTAYVNLFAFSLQAEDGKEASLGGELSPSKSTRWPLDNLCLLTPAAQQSSSVCGQLLRPDGEITSKISMPCY